MSDEPDEPFIVPPTARMKTLTVAELIAELSTMPQQLRVGFDDRDEGLCLINRVAVVPRNPHTGEPEHVDLYGILAADAEA